MEIQDHDMEWAGDSESLDQLPPQECTSCEHKRKILEMVDLPVPADSQSWNTYFDCIRDAERLSYVFDRRDDLKTFLRSSQTISDVFDKHLTVRSVGWRKGFGARILCDRYTKCIRHLLVEPEDDVWTRKILALADSIVNHPPKFRAIVTGTIHEYKDFIRRIVFSKTEAGDKGWLKEAYRLFHFMHSPILERTLHNCDTDLMCELIHGMMQEDVMHYGIASEVFHKLESRKIVQAVKDSRIQVMWSDIRNNHRLREQARRADPNIQPLDASFYQMVLCLQYCNSARYSHHNDVMSALDAVVEMHYDGRVSKEELDDFRDRMFAMSDKHGNYPVYRYLLEESNRLIGKRFSHAVIPFAMAGQKRIKLENQTDT